MSVISGQNTIHLITGRSLFTVPDISQSLFREVLPGDDEVEWTGKAEMSRLDGEALAVGKACQVMQGYITIIHTPDESHDWVVTDGWMDGWMDE